jgi:hypothetical protein
MSVPLDRCPHCGVLLSGVKCQNCGYTGGKSEFILNNHRCPKCQSAVAIPSAGYAAPPPPRKLICPFCSTELPDEATTCKGCGNSKPVVLGALKLKSVARTFMAAGILNILAGCLLLTIPPLGILVLLVATWQLVNANLFWNTPPKVAWSPKYVAVIEIITFLFGPIWNLIFGIVNLNRLGDPNVKAFYDHLYRDDPLKQKMANRRLIGWILIVVGGLFSGSGGLLMVINTVVQFTGSAPSEDLQGYGITMILCLAPILLIGLAMIGAGGYTLWKVKTDMTGMPKAEGTV